MGVAGRGAMVVCGCAWACAWGLHLSQGLLRDHEQLPILAPHEDHTWEAGEGAGVRNAPQGPTPRGANSPEEERGPL